MSIRIKMLEASVAVIEVVQKDDMLWRWAALDDDGRVVVWNDQPFADWQPAHLDADRWFAERIQEGGPNGR